MACKSPLILLTGGTGYIGGRLLSLLQQRGFRLRCLAQAPESLRGRVLAATEVVAGDVLDLESLTAAFRGVDTAYYLIHSMGSGRDFRAAMIGRRPPTLRRRPKQPESAGSSTWEVLAIRGTDSPITCEAGRKPAGCCALGGAGDRIPAPSIIIGSGSLSFELIRSLVERLPLMVCPKWVATPAQPIAVEDVLEYLIAALDLADEKSRTFEIGGPDQVCYGDIMRVRGSAGSPVR